MTKAIPSESRVVSSGQIARGRRLIRRFAPKFSRQPSTARNFLTGSRPITTRLLKAFTALLLASLIPVQLQAQIFIPLVEPPNPLERMQDAFERLVDRIAPSVVSIEAQYGPNSSTRPAQFAVGTVVGSGFVIRADGMILTSDHVVNGALSIHVMLSDGERRRARRVASDPRSDLAVIQVDAENLHPLQLGHSLGLRRGQIVLAFGNPLGLSADGHAAASFGLLGAIARPLPEALGQEEDRYYGDMIQTTAPIGPGYSGGPLVDIGGRVVGVITAATRHGPAVDSLGFAVPMTRRTREIIEKLLAGEDVEYGYLGVQVRDAAIISASSLADGTRDALSSRKRAGALLQFVYPDGPADRAGLLAGDIVVSVDSRAIESADQLVQLVGSRGPSGEVRIGYQREGAERECSLTLARRLPPATARPLAGRGREWGLYGATFAEVEPALRADASLPPGALMVKLVDAGSPADRAGLTPGDIVIRVDGQTVTPETGEMLAAISDDCLVGLANGGSVLIRRGK